MKKLLDNVLFRLDRGVHTSYLLIVLTLLASLGVVLSFFYFTHGQKEISKEEFLLWISLPMAIFTLWAFLVSLAVNSDFDSDWFGKNLLAESYVEIAYSVGGIASFVILLVHTFIVCCKYLTVGTGIGVGIALAVVFLAAGVGALMFGYEIEYECSPKFAEGKEYTTAIVVVDQ